MAPAEINLAAWNQISQAGDPQRHVLLLTIGAFSGVALIAWDSRRWNVPLKHRVGLIAAVLLGGLIGSSIPDGFAGGIIQQQSEQCSIAPKTIIAGLFFGFLSAAVYKMVARLKVETSDGFARGTCLMMAVGKLGCYAGHCCFGIATAAAWGVNLGDGVARVPVQILESAALFLLFGVLTYLQRQDRWRDRRLFLFFTAYGLIRFGFEFLRQPIASETVGVGFYQWLALGLAAVGLYQIVKRSRPSTHSPTIFPVRESA